MSKTVTIFGGSGFLGRYIAQGMALEGWRVRVAVRRPNEAMYVRPYGSPGQVEPVLCNIRNADTVRSAISGANAVVNCVGILNEIGANKFDEIHVSGAARVAEISARNGVQQLVHISALGADNQSGSKYFRSKAAGDQQVLENFPAAIILRPSIVFGNEDNLFNKFAKMTRFGPVLPIVGGNTLFQPVHVEDVAKAAVMGILGQVQPGTYELGGPEAATLEQLADKLLEVIERQRLVINLPFWAGSAIGGVLDAVQGITLGLVKNGILTRDQVKRLRQNRVVSDGTLGLSDLGIEPVAMASSLAEYLWVFRPAGEFSAIKNSAENLKKNA